MLSWVNKILPSLSSYVRAAYTSSSILFFGSNRLSSACGVQQEDPLGPLLFALAVRHISYNAVTRFAVWYLEEATIGGKLDVFQEVSWIRMLAEKIGLELNTSKCEIVSSSEIFNITMSEQLPNCKLIFPEYCHLLGAPIKIALIEPSFDQHASQLRNIKEKLRNIVRHDALALWRHSLGRPRSIYFLRWGPFHFWRNDQ